MAAPVRPMARERRAGAWRPQRWLIVALAWAASTVVYHACRPDANLETMLRKLEYPLKRKLTEREKANRNKMATGGLAVTLPRDGRQLGPDKVNIAVRDPEALAAEPVRVRLDRAGKTIREGEKESIMPFNTFDIGGVSSARAPLSWEEYEARYRNMDKRLQAKIGPLAMKQIEDTFSAQDGLEEYRTIRTFAWDGEDGSPPATVMLIGVTELSERSRQLASRAVFEAQPSGLLVQLCRERVGRHLVMPRQHMEAAANYARGYAATNPHQLRQEIYHVDIINGDFEALKLWMSDMAFGAAAEEFAQLPDSGAAPKVLCLGDVKESKLEALRKQFGNQTLKEVTTQSARSKQLVRGLVSMLRMGHSVVLGVVDADLLASVTTWLERAGARLVAVADTSDIEEGRESIAADVQLGLGSRLKVGQKGTPPQVVDQVLGFGRSTLGAFLNQEAMDDLQRRRTRLVRTTRIKDLVQHVEPPKVWKTIDLLGAAGHPPGPGGALDVKPMGLRFEFQKLEIPDHYLKDASMERHAPKLWYSLAEQQRAMETRDLSELRWWASGGTDTELAPPAALDEGDEDFEEARPGASQGAWPSAVPWPSQRGFPAQDGWPMDEDDDEVGGAWPAEDDWKPSERR